MPPKKSELPGSPKIQELDEDKADEPSLPPMTPESKQLAAVIATAVATAMAALERRTKYQVADIFTKPLERDNGTPQDTAKL